MEKYVGQIIRVATRQNAGGCGVNGELKYHDGVYTITHLYDADETLNFEEKDVAYYNAFRESDGRETVRIQLR